MTNVSQDLSPGAMLKAERESRSWSVGYICDQINLHERVIIALEADDYASLPPPAFVRGYIRSYAKLLEIESDPLVKKYEELEGPAADVVPLIESEASTNSDLLIRLISGVALVTALGVFGFWWYQSSLVEESPVSLDSDIPDAANNEDQSQDFDDLFKSEEPILAAGAQSAETPLVPGVSYERPSDLPVDDLTALPAVDVPVPTVLQNSPVIEGLSDETVALDNAPESIEDAVTLVQNSAAGAANTAPRTNNQTQETETGGDRAANASGEYALQGADILLLKTESESWVSVVDAADNRLMYGILTSGTPRKLEGVAPFNLVLGAASGVQLTINGSDVDFGSMIRKSNTARFVVEQSGVVHR